jgi:hypothetical protein
VAADLSIRHLSKRSVSTRDAGWRLGVDEPFGQHVNVLDVVGPHRDVVGVKLGEDVQGADGVHIVVENRDLHRPRCTTGEPVHSRPFPGEPRAGAA